MNKDLQTVQPQDDITTLISQAIKQNIPVETMERLLAMRKELKQEKAKEAFDSAMAKFQAECPTIEKTKGVPTKSGKIAYRFAPIDEIVNKVKPILGQNDLSYAIKTETNNGNVKATCIAKHIAGHSEESSFEVPLGAKTEIMSQSQVVAAALTFAKRYAFCNTFGIMTGDEDTDSVAKDKPVEVDDIDAEDIEKINATTTQEELLKLCGELKTKYPTKMKTLLNRYTFRKDQIESDRIADEVAEGIDNGK